MINFPSRASLIEFAFFPVHDCEDMDLVASLFLKYALLHCQVSRKHFALR